MRQKLTLLGAFVATGALMAGAAEAQSVLFTGYTNGCFNCVAPTADDQFQDDVLGGLTYENSVFEATTVDGFTGVGDNVTPLGVRNEDNFGGFYLDRSIDFSYTGELFRLLITFYDPSSNSSLFSASLLGNVRDGDGGPSVDFDNAWQSWFANGFKYSVRVNDLSLGGNGGEQFFAAPVTGDLMAEAVVPEPMSVILMSTGLLGVAFVARRRRNKLEQND